jgi:hypothetical protein
MALALAWGHAGRLAIGKADDLSPGAAFAFTFCDAGHALSTSFRNTVTPAPILKNGGALQECARNTLGVLP